MRRMLVVVFVAVVVNAPWAHQALVSHRIDTAGRDVTARLVAHPRVEGRYFLRYRVPGGTGVYSARVDRAHYDAAVAAGRVRVRVVPGSPNDNRVPGEVSSIGFVIIAAIADSFLVVALIAFVLRRRRTRRTVLDVDGDVLTLGIADRRLVAFADPARRDHYRVGRPARGSLVLVAASDVVPREANSEIDQIDGATYRVRGSVTDVGPGWVELTVDDALSVRVLTEGVRPRADLRQLAEVTGTFELRWEW